MSNDESVSQIVLELERDFTSGTGTLMSDYVRTDAYTDINTIYAYLNSKHISGSKDSLGRDKPFFNIVLAARNIWFRATDLDRKNINLSATKQEDIIGVFLLSIALQNWMKEENFGVFLNNWGMELAGFNSSVVKMIEKDGRLMPSIVSWSRLIFDQINFAENTKIEILELTESQLYDRFDAELVEALCNAEKARETTDKQKKDNKNSYYKLYEVHGVFPLSEITGKESDEDIYTQQMHIISFVLNEKTKENEQFTLYAGKEKQDPYILTSLLPATDGSVSFDGSVKNLFDAQWMINHSVKSIKDQLDLASKLIFQTADGNFVAQNALFAIESGDILVHQPNMPLTQLNNNSHDITSLQNFGSQWKVLSNEINGISDAMLGASPKAGTAWRQTEALLQENYSLFEIMTENKSLALEEMLRTHILPFLIKKSNNKKQMVATLNSYDIEKIDRKYIPYEATKRMAKKVINKIIAEGEVPEDMDEMLLVEEQGVREELDEMGMKRYIVPDEVDEKTWKDIFKDLEYTLDIDISGEAKNKQEMYATLNTALQTIMNPMFSQNPKAQLVVDKILTASGHISPLELSSVNNAQAKALPTQVSPPQGMVDGDIGVSALQGNNQ